MRIDRLNLIAYGPFTNVNLDFSQGAYGLHLVYGLNEAGKSSALRALYCLLYGFPHRTSDAFLHTSGKLRVGATLRDEDGNELKIIRRKGKEKTLRSEDDHTVVEEGRLQTLLQGIGKGMFESMFGVDHDMLVEGGKEIIEGGGDLGRLIFSAGSGISRLQTIQQRLESSAEELFRPRGQNQAINQLVKAYALKQKEIRAALLTGQEWGQIKHDLEHARLQKVKIVERLNDLKSERGRYERIIEALPRVGKRKELLNELTRVEHAPDLRDDFSDERRDLERQLSNHQTEKAKYVERIARLIEDINKIQTNKVLLDHSDEVTQKTKDLGSFEKAQRDRFGLAAQANTARREAEEIFADLGITTPIEKADTFRVEKSVSRKIRELISEHASIITKIKESGKRLPDLDTEIARMQKDLDSLPQARPLEELLVVYKEVADAVFKEQDFADTKEAMHFEEQAITLDQRKLGVGRFGIEDIAGLIVPSIDNIRQFNDGFEKIKRHQEKNDDDGGNIITRLAEVDKDLEEFRLAGEVPTEEDLKEAREVRDKGWSLILDILESNLPSEKETKEFVCKFQRAEKITDAFEAAVMEADYISDRLRREADRVVNQIKLLAEKHDLEKRSFVQEQERQKILDQWAGVTSQWRNLWAPLGITPGTPREMESWVRDFLSLVQKTKEFSSKCLMVKSTEEIIIRAQSKLSSCLVTIGVASSPDDSLAVLAGRAERVLNSEKEAQGKRERLAEQIRNKEMERQTLKRDLIQAEQEQAIWRKLWNKILASISLPQDWNPPQVQDYIDGLQSFFSKLKEYKGLQERIEGIDRDADKFRAGLQTLISVVAPELKGRHEIETVRELGGQIRAQTQESSKKSALDGELSSEEKSLAEVELALEQTGKALEALCLEAGCQSREELIEIEKLSAEKKRLNDQIELTDQSLRELAGGSTIDVFIGEITRENPDLLQSKIKELNEEIVSLEEKRSVLDQEIGAKGAELNRMDGKSTAAVLHEDSQSILGRLEINVTNYAKLRVGINILKRAIENYRQKYQDPILTRASELFAKLTCGAFAGIRADFDDSTGDPVILGIRGKDDNSVRVEGMSDGSADQLYLALRLAGLENYLKDNNPLPFVVDDVLIKFDDYRAQATLNVLSDISNETQIIFFSHHQHLVDLAKEVVPSNRLFNCILEH